MDEAPENQHISITIKGQDGIPIYFKIKRDAPMKKLLQSYCSKKLFDYNTMVFLLDSRRFDHKKTPHQLKLEDETEIDAFFVHFGGGGDPRWACNTPSYS